MHYNLSDNIVAVRIKAPNNVRAQPIFKLTDMSD